MWFGGGRWISLAPSATQTFVRLLQKKKRKKRKTDLFASTETRHLSKCDAGLEAECKCVYCIMRTILIRTSWVRRPSCCYWRWISRGGFHLFFFSAFAFWMRCSKACITSADHSRVLSRVFFYFLFLKMAIAASASQWISCYGSGSAPSIIYSQTVWAEYLVDRMPRHLRPGGAAVHRVMKMAIQKKNKIKISAA